MRKLILIAIVVLIYAAPVYSQRSEAGIFIGGSYYLGDLNPSKQFGNTKPAFGVLYRYNINTRWALKMAGTYGTLFGDDASSAGFNKQRNLNFKSYILDFAGTLELNFFNYYTGSEKYVFSPYIFTGLCVFSYNPKTQIGDTWYELQPLGTEGQGTTAFPGRKSYALTQAGIPFGLGVKISFSKLVCLGFEWGFRKTFTDYLDDVSTTYPDPVMLAAEKGLVSAALSNRSIDIPGEKPIVPGMQRGNSTTKDWYSFAGMTITIKILGKKDYGCRDFQNKHKYEEFLD